MTSSSARVLQVLDLFTVERPHWTAEEAMQALGLSRPTAFRYLRELVNAGLLMRYGSGLYMLGPRCIQFDYRIRVGDTLLAAAVPQMRELCERTGCGVTLAGLHGGRIIGLHLEEGPAREGFRYGRGKPMPLFRGSPSKMLVACLPAARQRALYSEHADEAAAGGLGGSWPEVKRNLNALRRQGWCSTRGELQPDLMGIAAPIRSADGDALAVMTLVLNLKRADALDHRQLRNMLFAAVQRAELALLQRRTMPEEAGGYGVAEPRPAIARGSPGTGPAA
jgi:DNA-binding IclR family transcriptional regulator